MTKYDILTIGGAVMDITFYTNDGKILDNPENDPTCLKFLSFEYGAKVKVDQANFTFGGGAQNAAVCFSRLGFKTATMMNVGNDGYGKSIMKNLKENKVEHVFVTADRSLQTGFSFVVTDQKTSEHVVFSYRGASAALSINLEKLKKISPKWIYITSLSGRWENVLEAIYDYTRKTNVKVAWNPGEAQLRAGYKKMKRYLEITNVLILNRDEAIELDLSSRGRENVTKDIKIDDLCADIYKLLGPEKIVVITDGQNGAYAYQNSIYYAPIKKVKRVNTTGVGDAFGSSFIAGLELYKGDIQKSLSLGILNTSSVIGKVGAENGLLYRKDIK